MILILDDVITTYRMQRTKKMDSFVSAGLHFFVNGKEVIIPNPNPEVTLLYFIRNECRLTGSKLGCAEGGCGACTVMVSKCMENSEIRHFAVNACLTPLCAVHGMAVTTVEGIGSTKTALHPVQERIAKAHGSQCGFCTPGFVMSMYSLLCNEVSPSEEQIEEAFQGNLCRCTGYRPILDGYKTFCCNAADKQCCKGLISNQLFDSSTFRPLDPTQQLIFPPKLLLKSTSQAVVFKGPRVQWYQPVTLKQLLAVKNQFLHTSKVVVGNTEIGVEVKFRNAFYEVLILPCHVPELNILEVNENGLLVGGAVTLSQLETKLRELVQAMPEHRTRTFSAMLDMLKWFAGQQIRNVAALGGNICNASPISDLNPLLMAAQATLNVASVDGCRVLQMNSSFFTAYKQTAMKPNEILVSVEVPFTSENEYFFAYKQARRRDDDIAIVNAGMRVIVGLPDAVVKDISLCYGGMSFKTVSAKETEQSLLGRSWDEDLLKDAIQQLLQEFPLFSNVPGGMPEYRRSLTISFFFKFFWSVKSHLPGIVVDPKLQSLTKPFHRPTARNAQGFQQVESLANPIGQPLMHLSAPLQASGEAHYTDDIPQQEGELYGGLVMSTHAHAEISVDWSPALLIDGCHGFVSVQDVPGSNQTGVFGDEKVFAEDRVTHFGQVIGMVLAEDRLIAERAAKLVQVSYTDLKSVITIEDAIAADSFFPLVRRVSQGNFDTAFHNSPHKLEGEVRVGGQDHFYLETHGCLAIPKGENGEIEIFASTQCVDGTQKMAAKALGVPANRIVARVKRIGGGFGGKESRSFLLSTAVAVAANKFNKPVRVILDRNQDMIASGGRHPYLGQYKVGFTAAGSVLALDLRLYSNAGNSIDLSYGVNERAITHADNVYHVPNLIIEAKACCTNLPSNTAFRGFGGPQGMMIMEMIMAQVACQLEIAPEVVRERNMYQEGDSTPYGMVLNDCTIGKCWAQLSKSSSFSSRRTTVDKFNNNSRWKKRGLAMVPTKFGVAFGALFMNQAAALLHVYTDGSVLLSHGGMEMGQGLHTKMVQVCSCLLKIPAAKIHILETNSSIVCNASPTAASYSTDLYGMAVKDCCEQILQRLGSVIADDPEAGWDVWVKTAYMQRINLSAQGFYTSPNIGINWETGKGDIFNYFAYGVSCSEVEIDCLTGDFIVLRTDIVQDVGDSINPAIDIGQVEGAFMQGMGLFTMEQCVYLEGSKGAQRGQLFTTGPGTYKIPSCQDIPVDFRVALLGRSPNPKAIFSSKAVGEPPLFLASSVFFAIQDAVNAARKSAGETKPICLDSPATCERIRMACSDHLTRQVFKINGDKAKGAKKWTIEV